MAEQINVHGIYKVEAGSLTYCLVAADKPRPTEFKTTAGTGHVLIRLEYFHSNENEIAQQLQDANVHFEKNDVGKIAKIVVEKGQNAREIFPLAAQLTQLESIQADGIDDKTFALLEGLEHLHEVKLYGDELTNKGLAVILNLPVLTNIEIGSRSITDEGLEIFADFPRHISLSLPNANLTAAGLNSIPSNCFFALKLHRIDFSEQQFRTFISKHYPLPSLSLIDCGIPAKTFPLLAKLTSLHSLDLSGYDFDEKSIQQIASLSTLQNLHLNDTEITDEDVQLLVDSLPSLRQLSLKRCPKLTATSLEIVRQNERLNQLWIAPGDFSEEELESFNQNNNSKIHIRD